MERAGASSGCRRPWWRSTTWACCCRARAARACGRWPARACPGRLPGAEAAAVARYRLLLEAVAGSEARAALEGAVALRDEVVVILLARLLGDLHRRWAAGERTVGLLPAAAAGLAALQPPAGRSAPAAAARLGGRLPQGAGRRAGHPAGAAGADRAGGVPPVRAVLLDRAARSARPLPAGQHGGRRPDRRVLAAAVALAAGDQAGGGGAALRRRRLRLGRTAGQRGRPAARRAGPRLGDLRPAGPVRGAALLRPPAPQRGSQADPRHPHRRQRLDARIAGGGGPRAGPGPGPEAGPAGRRGVAVVLRQPAAPAGRGGRPGRPGAALPALLPLGAGAQLRPRLRRAARRAGAAGPRHARAGRWPSPSSPTANATSR